MGKLPLYRKVGLLDDYLEGTPTIVSRGQEDVTVLLSGDLRHGPKKNPQAEHQMRRTIQDLVASIDPNVKILPEVEDVSLGKWSQRAQLMMCLVAARDCG